MTTLVLETEPVAVHVTVTEDKLTVDLVDGRSLVVPLAWYPRLVQGSKVRLSRTRRVKTSARRQYRPPLLPLHLRQHRLGLG